MAKAKASKFEWSRDARRVQPLVGGVRVFDHAGRGFVFADRVESVPLVEALLDSIREVDEECANRVLRDLTEWATT